MIKIKIIMVSILILLLLPVSGSLSADDAWVTDSSGTYVYTKVGIGTTPLYTLDLTSPQGTNYLFRFGITGLTNGFYATSDSGNNISYNFLNGNVGIGTTNPTLGKLTIESPASSTVSSLRLISGGSLPNNDIFIFGINGLTNGFRMRQDASSNVIYSFQDGNVGIGITTPFEKLHVADGSLFLGPNFHDGTYGRAIKIGWEGDPDVHHSIQTTISQGEASANGIRFYVHGGGASDNQVLNMTLTGGGNVGIGTTNPQSKLAVNGTITTKEVKVTDAGWSDFVFEDKYNLPSLTQVESFIKENKHLPDIPSAKQVGEEGLSVAEMMAKQMQKIEELTLYVIEQNKELAALKNENEEIKQKLEKLFN